MQRVAQGPGTGADPLLSFDGPLLIVGGVQVESARIRALAQRCVGRIGADVGADVLLDAGIVPDAVVGDMDSVRDSGRFPEQTRIVRLSEQLTTDFEKCLYSTSAPVTIAVGMTGGRFDHTLAALHAVARHARHRKIVLMDESDLALGVAGSIALEVGEGARVSIYPLGRTEFAGSEGLLYPLDGLVMEQGKMIGTSNRTTGPVLRIEVAEGEQDPWLLILDRDLLDVVL